MMEFDLIEALRARATLGRSDVALGIGDDAAVLDVPSGTQLVACTDTMVAGVHFLGGSDPADLGWKSLAVNLSDLAAMGAEPLWALLALTLPEADGAFVDGFARGFTELAGRHRVALVGGDTTQGPLTITVTALGTVPSGTVLTRGGAHEGDAVFVTGTLGDAAGALRLIRDRKSHFPQSRFARVRPAPPFLRTGEDEHAPLPQGGRGAVAGGGVPGRPERIQRNAAVELVARMHRPEPRVAAGLALRDLASACIDVSDGLLADLGHVCRASGVAAGVVVDALPISAELRAQFDEAACRGLAMGGGDDYELCFTAPAEHESDIAAALAQAGCRATRIGRIVAGAGVRVLDANGNRIDAPHTGWEHFSE